MVTPLHLAIALHYHTREDEYEMVVENPVRHQYAADLVAAGLLEPLQVKDGYITGFRRTEGLAVWVNALCSTPFPVKQWVMPESVRP